MSKEKTLRAALALALVLILVLGLAGCGRRRQQAEEPQQPSTADGQASQAGAPAGEDAAGGPDMEGTSGYGEGAGLNEALGRYVSGGLHSVQVQGRSPEEVYQLSGSAQLNEFLGLIEDMATEPGAHEPDAGDLERLDGRLLMTIFSSGGNSAVTVLVQPGGEVSVYLSDEETAALRLRDAGDFQALAEGIARIAAAPTAIAREALQLTVTPGTLHPASTALNLKVHNRSGVVQQTPSACSLLEREGDGWAPCSVGATILSGHPTLYPKTDVLVFVLLDGALAEGEYLLSTGGEEAFTATFQVDAGRGEEVHPPQ